jgi:hypothetical protein
VLDLLPDLAVEVIKDPPAATPPAITQDPTRRPFWGCVGALDGTHIPAHVPLERQRPYRDRHGKISMNVMAAVDFWMRFTHVLVGWEGSAHDGRVVRSAVERGFKPPEGFYYLADAGYSNCSMWLTLYRGVRYHLREIRQAARRPEDKYELFNFRHSSLRIVVERTFGVFKRRWRIYDHAPEYNVDTQIKLMYGLAAVHNFIAITEDVDGDRDFKDLKPAPSEANEGRAARDRGSGRSEESRAPVRSERVIEEIESSIDLRREAIADEL